jgi:lycopene cyclase domain-containing protein
VKLPGAYLIALLFSIGGLLALDLRYSLALRKNPVRTLATLLVAVALFLGWDLIGVGSGVFYEGASGLLLGIDLLPNLPLEEVFFLLLMNYSVLLGFLALERWRLYQPAKSSQTGRAK